MVSQHKDRQQERTRKHTQKMRTHAYEYTQACCLHSGYEP